MIFKITKQFCAGGSREQPFSQSKTLEAARAAVAENVESDAAMKIQAIYRIYEFDDLMETIDSRDIQSTNKSAESASGSQGMQSGASFRPSPLQTSPRPKGTMPNSWVDPEDKNKE